MGAGAFVVVLVWLAALSVYDVRQRRLPNWLTLPGAIMVIAVAAGVGRGLPAVLGAITLFAIYAVVHLLSPAALGGGDVKLALGAGALTGMFGPEVWTLAALGAPLLTAVWGVGAILRGAGSTVPHGPAMCLATAATVGLTVVSV